MWNESMIKICRKAVAEGAVLLKNENEMLPLKNEEVVAIFGRIQLDYYKCGTGSGGDVKIPYSINLIEGLQNNEAKLQETLLTTYKAWIAENPYDAGDGSWASEPWNQKEMPLTDDLIKEVKESVNKAVVVFGRTAGEDKDNMAERGSYYLTEDELLMLKRVCAHFDKVAVVLNVSNIIDMSWMLDEAIASSLQAVLYAWQGGMESGSGIADVLMGKVSPSGKLTDTIAYKLEQYPSTDGFAKGRDIIYQEDIYVGYRYFETFHPEYVQYAFGYGLSYTDFSIQIEEVIANETEVSIFVKITNTGRLYIGKEVVQLYYEAPQGRLGKAKRVLGAFAKTRELQPGESQIIALNLLYNDMASYDDSGVTGFVSAYVLEAGRYHLYVGNSIRNVIGVQTEEWEAFIVDDARKAAQLEAVMQSQHPFARVTTGLVRADGTYEVEYKEISQISEDLKERIEERFPEEILFTGNRGLKLVDVKTGVASMKEFVAQLTDEEMAAMTRGEGMSSLQVTNGTAAAFGGLSPELASYGIPIACAADGPSGIRMTAKASLVPIGTMLASTWNESLIEEMYGYVGKECKEHKIDTLLGPGMNIHRNPLNGRNFEYYSEDPLVTGKIASAVLKGLASWGAIGTIKHFACNNREQERNYANAIVSERALREIYLKGFEIAVKEGKARSIMTAYSLINGQYTAANYDLNTTVLRKEWGYTGMVMTDWWANLNHVIDGSEPNRSDLASMIRAQNDIYMVIENNGARINSSGDNILPSLSTGILRRGELQQSVRNLCNVLLETYAMDNNHLFEDKVPVIEPFSDYSGEVTVKPDGNGIVKADMSIPTLVTIEKEGIYTLTLEYCLKKSILAQVQGGMVINGGQPNFFAINGTEGAQKKRFLLKAKLIPGVYQIMAGASDPEFEMKSVIFTEEFL